MNPIEVFCPTCLAKAGNPCRSVVPWNSGIVHGQGSELVYGVYHKARKDAARAKAVSGSGFRIVSDSE